MNPAISQNDVDRTDAPLQISHASARESVGVPATNFTGSVTLEMLFVPDGPDRTSAGAVTFAPGARTNWHSHPLGQTLLVTAGVGRVQRWGGPIQQIRPGDVVRIPPNVKHWHGAAQDIGMIHVAIQEADDGRAADWLEPVSDAQFDAPVAACDKPASQPV
jgi:4-carboxymuconolactone decarboxylase